MITAEKVSKVNEWCREVEDFWSTYQVLHNIRAIFDEKTKEPTWEEFVRWRDTKRGKKQ